MIVVVSHPNELPEVELFFSCLYCRVFVTSRSPVFLLTTMCSDLVCITSLLVTDVGVILKTA